MFAIGSTQIAQLSEQSKTASRRRLADTITYRAAPLIEMAGDAAVFNFIDEATHDAEVIGLTEPAAKRFYIDLAIICGIKLRTDAQYAFLGVPETIGYRDEMLLVDTIHGRLTRYMATVLGTENQFLVDVIRGGIQMEWTGSDLSTAESLAGHMESIWPQRAAFIGAPLLYHTMADALSSSGMQDLPPIRRALLASVFGNGWFNNPLCEWLAVPLDLQTARLSQFADAVARGSSE